MQVSDLGEEDGLDGFEKATKIALIDCDTVAYAAASSCQYADDDLPKHMYSDEEWNDRVTSGQYDETEQCLWKLDLDKAIEYACMRVEEIKEAAFCKDVELYFSSGHNFRFDVDPMYKANRGDTRYPPELIEVKKALVEKYGGEICNGIEADDAVVFLKRTKPDKYVLCAVDKDVYRSVPGKHFNYYYSDKYNIPMKWVTTLKEDAEKFPYIQCLMGDSTDNIMGVPGIGPKKAEKALAGMKTSTEMWSVVVDKFEEAGLTIKDAIRTMRLVNMHQVERKQDGSWEWTPWTQPI